MQGAGLAAPRMLLRVHGGKSEIVAEMTLANAMSSAMRTPLRSREVSA